MKLTMQCIYKSSVFTKDNSKEFKNYYVAADSINEATVMLEYKIKQDNIYDSVYINSIVNTGQCLIKDTKEEVEPPLKNKDVTERIKTFDDAYNELGSNHPFCKAWDSIYHGNGDDDCEDIKDVIAYHKLRIIVAALNEGWKPKFTKDEYRYYTYHCFYTKQGYDNLPDEEKKTCRAVGSANNSANAGDGLFFAYVSVTFSNSRAYHRSRIAFKNRELAEYAGQQFFDIYADFLA